MNQIIIISRTTKTITIVVVIVEIIRLKDIQLFIKKIFINIFQIKLVKFS
jgi:hypothetical protein